MKKLIVLIIVLAIAGGGYYAYTKTRKAPEPVVTTVPVSRGDVVDAVAATGTLQAVETVSVGTQVSGTVDALYADFNTIVKKGQIIARLDPSLIQTQIEQQEANVVRSEADLDRLKVSLADANQKYERAKAMFDKSLIPKTDLETAEVNVKSAVSQIKSSEASLVQAKASLNNQKVNLNHTVITAPIDGIVIARSVDQGQTVAASMNAPTLFILAADLTKMEVLASIDESDVGRMRPGQVVTFNVDAFPTETFSGSVKQVRLQPAVVQNVVTYSTVISVPNNDYKLKPGMTAKVNIEVARKSNVLRLPAAALRFRPTELMFTALNQEVPPEARAGRGLNAGGAGGGGRNGGGNRTGGNGGNGGNRNGQAGQGAPGAPGGAPAAAGAPASAPAPAPAAAAPTASAQAAPAAPGGGRSAEARSGGDRAAAGGGNGQPGAGGEGRGGGGRGFDPNMTPEERRKAMEERMAAMSPEERQRFEERRAARGQNGQGGQGGQGAPGGAGPGGFGGRGGPGAAGQPGSGGFGARGAQGGNRANAQNAGNAGRAGAAAAAPRATAGAATVDALFGPLPEVETRGRAWTYVDKKLKAVNLRLGATDGTFTEILGGEVEQGTEVVTNLVTGLEPKTTTPGQPSGQNPFAPQPGRGGPGGPGGGGRGGGRQ